MPKIEQSVMETLLDWQLQFEAIFKIDKEWKGLAQSQEVTSFV